MKMRYVFSILAAVCGFVAATELIRGRGFQVWGLWLALSVLLDIQAALWKLLGNASK